MSEWKVDGSSALQPEHQRALGFAFSKRDTLQPVLFDELSSRMWCQGEMALVVGSFATKHIPRGPHWRWNQTRSRKRVSVKKDCVQESVQFWKMVPRKSLSSNPTPIPSIKLWIFSLGNDQTHLLWCERGIFSLPSSPDSSFKPPADLSILSEDLLWELEFLRPLMDPSVAEEIWPTYSTLFNTLC